MSASGLPALGLLFIGMVIMISRRLAISQILGFLVLATLRSLEIVPGTVVGPVTKITSFLTVVSMAALGLGVDVRVLANVGGRVTAAVTLSLMLLLGISIALVHWFK